MKKQFQPKTRWIVLLCLITSTARAENASLTELLKSTFCESKIRAHISEKLARQGWAPVVVSVPFKELTNGLSFRDLKVKKAYQIWTDAAASNILVSDLASMKETLYSYNSSGCQETSKVQNVTFPPMPKNAGGFTDKDLDALVKKNSWGVIYIWTPYMPLSVKGLAQIKQAVKEKGGQLTVLMDPKAKLDDVKGWETAGLVTLADETPVSSNEIFAQSFFLHYPCVFVYKDGELSNRTFIGFKAAKMYKKWFEIELAQLQRDLL